MGIECKERPETFGLSPSSDKNAWWRYGEPLLTSNQNCQYNVSLRGLTTRSIQTDGVCVHVSWKRGLFAGSFEDLCKPIRKPHYRVVYRLTSPCPKDNIQKTCQEVWSWPEGSMELILNWGENPQSAEIGITTTDLNVFHEVMDYAGAFITLEKGGVVKCLTRPSAHEPYKLVNLGRFEAPFDPLNYSPETIEAFDRLVSDVNSTTPRGRMSIIHGPPGTGKTFLLKALTRKCPDSSFVFIPNDLVKDLGNPEMIEVLRSSKTSYNQRLILLAEDADIIFRKRGADNVSAISNALNLTDGILGELLKVYIVGTTNVTLDDIDEAIKRPGRLSEQIHVGPLCAEQTASVYRKVKGDPKAPVPEGLARGATLAETYAAAR